MFSYILCLSEMKFYMIHARREKIIGSCKNEFFLLRSYLFFPSIRPSNDILRISENWNCR